jgi:hypothetical protein
MKATKQATKAALANSKGNKKGAFERRVLGATKELGEHIYVVNTRNQAEKYLRTTEKIAQYAGLHVSKEMRILVLHGESKIAITKPEAPKKADAEKQPGRMEEYKVELSAYQRKIEKVDDDKAKLFVIILGQCTEKVKLKLKADDEFASLESKYDVDGLLKKLRIMAFSTGAMQHKFLTAQDVLKRFINISQGPRESIEHYLLRFNAIAEVLGEIFGPLFPEKMVSQKSDATATSSGYKTMVFLCGADCSRYGKLLDEYRNSYLAGKDYYPDKLDEAVSLLSNYHDGQAKTKTNRIVDGEDDLRYENPSFAQKSALKKKGVKIVCYKCGQEGHTSPQCPMNDQESDDGSVKSASSQGSRRSQHQQLHWSGEGGFVA